MNNQLAIFGSEIFYSLLKDLDSFDNVTLNNYKLYKKNLEHKKKDNIVKIIFPENLKIEEVKDLLKEDSPSVLLVSDNNFFKKKKLNLYKFNYMLSLPIDVLALIDLVGILLIKYQFFKNSEIIIKGYKLDSNQKTIKKKDVVLKLTEKEVELLLALRDEKALSKSDLLKRVWDHKIDLETHTVESNIYRLRKKISDKFNDNDFILENDSRYSI
jgi:DNA-binding response OmpR family regulator